MESNPLPRWQADLKAMRVDIENCLLGAFVYDRTDAVLRGNPALDLDDPLLWFIERWYYQAMAATIRRHIKDAPQTYSLLRLLKQIAVRPALVGMEPADIQADIDRLSAVTSKIEEYADRTVPHLDRRGIQNPAQVAEFKHAVVILGEVFAKYVKCLLKDDVSPPSVILQDRWTNILDTPWRHPAPGAA